MHVSEYLSLAELDDAVKHKAIRRATHDTLPLVLYTYTEHALYQGQWTDAEQKCRGLIVEDTGQIVGRCLSKFWNFSEHTSGRSYAKPLPDEAFQIFAKQDGSLGTVFFYDDQWHVATKGSFHSEQAKWATRYIRAATGTGETIEGLVGHDFDPLNKQKTYVCEIVYPTNRIVVNYGSLETLVLLTVLDNETGEEEFTEEHKLEWGWIGDVVQEFDPNSLSVAELQELADENVLLANGLDEQDRVVTGTDMEGYVVRFRNGTRVKVKGTDYLRLHKVLTNCTERSVWEVLSSGGSFDEFLADVPDEFYTWVTKVTLGLSTEHDRLINEAREDFRYFREQNGDSDKKTFAEYALRQPSPSALFMLWDGNEDKLSDWAWKQLRPEATKPFNQGGDSV